MKLIKSLSWVITLSLFIATACENRNTISDKSLKNENTPYLSDHLGEKISIDFNGTILDKNKNPIKDASVSIGNQSAITDSIGNFKIRNANVNVHFAYIEAKKEGYRSNAINMTPIDSINEVKIILEVENESCIFWFCRQNHSLSNFNP